SISEMDSAEMDEFIDNMGLILGVLGYKILEPSVIGVNNNVPLFYLQERSGANAYGKPNSEGFVIFKDSVIAQNVASSLSQSVIMKRQNLIEKKIINEQYVFTQDWQFSSPSLAAEIVVGYSTNGRAAWKDKRGVSLKEMESKGKVL
ncbi:MAG: DUF4357 domain-containing protein, partial [Lachnospiraceae bacterium]|nr:DUF4357 domain-containing protein [Lachnospiraceae bacterium]